MTASARAVPYTAHNKNAAIDFVTIATNIDAPPRRMAKFIERYADGTYTIHDYDEGATWFRFEQHPLGSATYFHDLWQVIAGLSQYQCLIPGKVRDGVDSGRALRRSKEHDGIAPTLEDCGHWHLICDFDKIPAKDAAGDFDSVAHPERAVRYLRTLLPPEFKNAACLWQLSSSAGYKATDGKPTINMKLIFLLSRPLTCAEIKLWLKPYLKLKQNGTRGVLDHAIYRPTQPIYLAAPVLAQGTDIRVTQRAGHMAGELVQVPPAEAEREVEVRQGRKRTTRREKIFEDPHRAKALEQAQEQAHVEDAFSHINPARGREEWAEIGFASHWTRIVGMAEGQSREFMRNLFSRWMRGELHQVRLTAEDMIHLRGEHREQWEDVFEDGAYYNYGFRTIAMYARQEGWQPEAPETEILDDGTEVVVLTASDWRASARRFIEVNYPGEYGYPALRRHRGAFYIWTGTHFESRSQEEMDAQAWDFLDYARVRSQDADGNWTTAPFRPDPAKVTKLLKAVMSLVQLPESLEPPAWVPKALEEDPDCTPPSELIPCHNGVLNLTLRHLHDHDSAFFNLNSLNVPYQADAGLPNEWLNFLESLFPNDSQSIALLQEMFGYMVSGRTDLQKVFFLLGPSRSGRGTIFRVLTELLGEQNVTSPSLTRLGKDFGMENLIGTSACLITDAAQTRLAPEAVEAIKAISGEDHVSISRKYQTDWKGTLRTRFAIASNHPLNFSDTSGALSNRIVPLKLTRSFVGQEDVGLGARLTAELPAILNWSLAGLDRLNARGRFDIPESARSIFDQMVPPIARFVDERCKLYPDATVTEKELFADWRTWCQEEGHQAGSKQHMLAELTSRYPDKVRRVRPKPDGDSHRPFVYQGIALRESKCKTAEYPGFARPSQFSMGVAGVRL
jgi:putative DNA primase/helicase